MPVVARIQDTNHPSSGKWFLILRQGQAQVAGNILDGRAADPEGTMIPESILGERFNCPEARLDRPNSRFYAFPVRVYGPKKSGNPSGEYEIASDSAEAVPAQPGSVLKTGMSASSLSGSVSPRVPSAPGGGGSTGTAVATPPIKKAQVQRVKPKVAPAPSAVGLSASGTDGSPTVYIDRVATFLDVLPVQQTVMLWGPAGIGKSEVIHDYCQERNLRLYDLRMSMMDPTTIGGVGVPNLNTRRTEFLPIEYIPSGPNCVLLLDEITAAPPTIQALGYQITWDRRIGSVPLPEDCRVICAGNRVTDKGVAYTMPSPLANRLFHLTVNADLGAWKKWAFNRGIDPRIVSFLTLRVEFLHKMDPAQAGSAWPSPRSWANVDRVLKSNLGPVDLGIGIAACVGVAACKDFIRHCESYGRQTKRLEDILNGFAKDYNELDPSKAQTIGIAVVANTTDDPRILENVIVWAKKQNDEYQEPILSGLRERFGEELLSEIPAYSGLTPQDADDDTLPF